MGGGLRGSRAGKGPPTSNLLQIRRWFDIAPVACALVTAAAVQVGDPGRVFGTILANHTRGLDDDLQRQAGRIEQRQGHLLAESAGELQHRYRR